MDRPEGELITLLCQELERRNLGVKVNECRSFRILFTSERKLEPKIDRLIGARSSVMQLLY